MSEKPKMTVNEVRELHAELVELEGWLNPDKPDPNQWPPKGWREHPQYPGFYFRMLSDEELREEIYGSEEKADWLKTAAARIEEIKAALIPYFFPKAQEEGTARREKAGFVTMLKTGLDRKFDVPALAAVVADCQKEVAKEGLLIDVEDLVVKWTPELKLTEYRTLPEGIRKKFENALIIKPQKAKFEIVRVSDPE